ncbi:MAG: RNA polymerase sigma factor [Planctomycetota bacterium]
MSHVGAGFSEPVLREQLALAERNGWHTNARLLQLWWQWCEHGDDSAGNEVLDSLRGPVLRRLQRALPSDADEAESLTQETLMTIVQKRHEFRAASSVLAWAQGIAHNKVREALRRARRRKEVPLREAASDEMAAAEASSGEHDLDAVRAAMARALDDVSREVIRLTAEGLTRDEIAQRLGIPAGTVATKLHRARARVQDALKKRPS